MNIFARVLLEQPETADTRIMPNRHLKIASFIIMNVILTNDYYNSNWIYIDSINFLLNSSSTPTFKSLAILAMVSRSG